MRQQIQSPLSAPKRLSFTNQRQLTLLKEKKYSKRKVRRVISIKQYNHCVLKSHLPVLRRHAEQIKRVIREEQIKWKIELKALAIECNHIHLALKTPSRESFANFHRSVAGRIAKLVLGKLRTAAAERVGAKSNTTAVAKTNKSLSLNGISLTSLWKQRLWSRAVKYERDLANTARYIFQNPAKSGVLDLLQTDLILFDKRGILRQGPLLL
ncbi:MAG: transposase [Bdellovibrionota bacterium]